MTAKAPEQIRAGTAFVPNPPAPPWPPHSGKIQVDVSRKVGNAILDMFGVTDQNITKFSLHCDFGGLTFLEIEHICDEPNADELMKVTTKYRLVPEE